jgi:hypothetical protein
MIISRERKDINMKRKSSRIEDNVKVVKIAAKKCNAISQL